LGDLACNEDHEEDRAELERVEDQRHWKGTDDERSERKGATNRAVRGNERASGAEGTHLIRQKSGAILGARAAGRLGVGEDDYGEHATPATLRKSRHASGRMHDRDLRTRSFGQCQTSTDTEYRCFSVVPCQVVN
jgi:hypothetical protein